MFTVSGSLEVDVRVSERAAGESISTDSDRLNRTQRSESLEQHGFSHVRLQIAHIQRAAHLHLHLHHRQISNIEAELRAQKNACNDQRIGFKRFGQIENKHSGYDHHHHHLFCLNGNITSNHSVYCTYDDLFIIILQCTRNKQCF